MKVLVSHFTGLLYFEINVLYLYKNILFKIIVSDYIKKENMSCYEKIPKNTIDTTTKYKKNSPQSKIHINNQVFFFLYVTNTLFKEHSL